MTTPTTTERRVVAANVTTAGAHAVARAGQWSQREAQLIGSIIAPGLSADELRVFAAVCRHTGLDPFRKQIYAWKDRGKLTIHIAINGLRAQASRSGEYEGQVGPEWCGPDGVWRDVWLSDDNPAACRVGILRRGFAAPVWSTVTWREFARTQSRTGAKGPTVWDEKGPHMLAVRAEGHGLQRTFPELFDQGFAEATAVGATIMAADESEMPALPQQVDTETGELLEGPQIEPSHAGEDRDETGEEAPSARSDADQEPSPAIDYEAFYAALLDAVGRAKLRPMDVCAFLGVRNQPDEIHAAMSERGLDVGALLTAVKAFVRASEDGR